MINSITVTSVRSAFTVHSAKGRFETVNRKYFGLSLCREGELLYKHNESTVISDALHAVFLPAGETYTLSSDRNGVFPVINFTCTGKPFSTVSSIPTKNTKALINDFERIRTLLLFGGSRLEILSVFYRMLHMLSNDDAENAGTVGPIAPAIHYLTKNFASCDITNALLAEKCHISEVWFRRLFIKQYGVTPKQFIIDIRINRAKQLLSEGSVKISSVAQSCGFSNPYHFCRLFKEKTGLTPTEYMNKNSSFEM